MLEVRRECLLRLFEIQVGGLLWPVRMYVRRILFSVDSAFWSLLFCRTF